MSCDWRGVVELSHSAKNVRLDLGTPTVPMEKENKYRLLRPLLLIHHVFAKDESQIS